jgi:hypothetical protein
MAPVNKPRGRREQGDGAHERTAKPVAFWVSRFWLQWPASALYTPEPKTGPPYFPALGRPEETS